MHARLLLAVPLLAALAACDVAAGLFAPPTASPSPSASPTASPSAGPSGSPAPGASAGPSASPSPTPDPRLPTEAATIEGEVLSAEPAAPGTLHSGRIHVTAGDGGNQAMVTLVPATTVWRKPAGKDLARASTSDLKVGQRVRVWAGGPIRESFPIQFDARTVLILAE